MTHQGERQGSQQPGLFLNGDESFGELDFGALATRFLLGFRLLGRCFHFIAVDLAVVILRDDLVSNVQFSAQNYVFSV